MRPDLVGLGRAVALLAFGFAVADTGPGRAIGEGVAAGLAAIVAPILHVLDPGIERIGTELRGASGWAVRVTEVCDGHGLVISLAAALAATAPNLRTGLWRFAAGLAAIQLFNLVRILALALVLARAPAAFDAVHAVVFPLLTAALLALCVLSPRRAMLWMLLAGPLVLLWLPFSEALSQALVPPANLILPLVGAEFGQIAQRAAGWTLGTNLLATEAAGQVSRFLVPLRPADFTLAVPLILSAVILARRPLLLVPAALSLLIALVVAGVTSVWGLAAAQTPARLLVPDGSGAFLVQEFSRSENARSLAILAQNVLIHLNLLVLPLLMVAMGRRHA